MPAYARPIDTNGDGSNVMLPVKSVPIGEVRFDPNADRRGCNSTYRVAVDEVTICFLDRISISVITKEARDTFGDDLRRRVARASDGVVLAAFR